MMFSSTVQRDLLVKVKVWNRTHLLNFPYRVSYTALSVLLRLPEPTNQLSVT